MAIPDGPGGESRPPVRVVGAGAFATPQPELQAFADPPPLLVPGLDRVAVLANAVYVTAPAEFRPALALLDESWAREWFAQADALAQHELERIALAEWPRHVAALRNALAARPRAHAASSGNGWQR